MGNFQERKLLRKFHYFVPISKKFVREVVKAAWIIGSISKQSTKVLSVKSHFLPTRESFPHKRFPLYGI